MARAPKYERATNPMTFRPRPTSEDTILEIVERTGRTRGEIADEALALGLPMLVRKLNRKRHPELRESEPVAA